MILNLINYNLSAQQIIQNPADCSDLFFSEIYVSKDQNPNGGFYLNYSIEIYNPTSVPIVLSNYNLTLIKTGNVLQTIPFTNLDILQPHDCYVVSNSNCDNALQNITDKLNGNLDFGNSLSIELNHNQITIDAIGEKIPSTTVFDFVQFQNDPYGYLGSLDINLDDVQNINIRRGHFVKAGEPNFSASKMLGKWAFYLNNDRSNIGIHNGACYPTQENVVTVGWNSSKEVFCFNKPQSGTAACYSVDPMVLEFSFDPINSYPTNATISVRYKPTYNMGGNLIKNCFYYDDVSVPTHNVLYAEPLIPSNCTLINQGTLYAAPEYIYTENPSNTSTCCWTTLSTQATASAIYNTDFKYEDNFNLNNGNVTLNGAPSWSVQIDQASSNHQVILEGNKPSNDGLPGCVYPFSAPNSIATYIKNNLNYKQANGVLGLKWNTSEFYTFELFDLMGRQLLKQKSNSAFSIDLNNYSNSLFQLKVSNKEGFYVIKLMK